MANRASPASLWTPITLNLEFCIIRIREHRPDGRGGIRLGMTSAKLASPSPQQTQAHEAPVTCQELYPWNWVQQAAPLELKPATSHFPPALRGTLILSLSLKAWNFSLQWICSAQY